MNAVYKVNMTKKVKANELIDLQLNAQTITKRLGRILQHMYFAVFIKFVEY